MADLPGIPDAANGVTGHNAVRTAGWRSAGPAGPHGCRNAIIGDNTYCRRHIIYVRQVIVARYQK
ncbi:hypothetical protein [Solwaraspora sp. WMMA2101]|uniref:hypothetical protein n=1 Tax=Solwaraspora sp. WMMA2101 TaxID=3404124 RepID=UPI003B961186